MKKRQFIRWLRRWLDTRLAAHDLQLVSRSDRGKGYIDAAEMIVGAEASGISVNEYIDKALWPGHMTYAQRLVDEVIVKYGLRIVTKELVVCEIGAGSGRHMEILMGRLPISRYEVYETNPEWREYLSRHPKVRAVKPTGDTLSTTATGSVNLLQAHSVFVYVPFLVALSYLEESARVVQKGGLVVFDVFTEASMTDDNVDSWLSKAETWPVVLPRQFMIDFLVHRGFRLIAGDLVEYGSAGSAYFIFEKTGL